SNRCCSSASASRTRRCRSITFTISCCRLLAVSEGLSTAVGKTPCRERPVGNALQGVPVGTAQKAVPYRSSPGRLSPEFLPSLSEPQQPPASVHCRDRRQV